MVATFVKHALIAASTLFALPAQAANIVYNVNSFAGAVGHVTGTITTDGALGTISASNIIGWSLNVLGDGASDLLTNGNSGVFGGGASTLATASTLSFDFDNPSASFLLFQKSFGSGANYVCYASTLFSTTPCVRGISFVPESFSSTSGEYSSNDPFIAPYAPLSPISGSVVIGTAAIPEPAAWALLLAGFGLTGAAMRRRAKVRVTYA